MQRIFHSFHPEVSTFLAWNQHSESTVELHFSWRNSRNIPNIMNVRSVILMHYLIPGTCRRFLYQDAVSCITKDNKLRQKAACGRQHIIFLLSSSFLPKPIYLDWPSSSRGAKATRYEKGCFEGAPIHLPGYFLGHFGDIRTLVAYWLRSTDAMQNVPAYACKHRRVNKPFPPQELVLLSCSEEASHIKNKYMLSSHCFQCTGDVSDPEAKGVSGS